MSLPLVPFPISPPSLPTIETLFRKKVIIEEDAALPQEIFVEEIEQKHSLIAEAREKTIEAKVTSKKAGGIKSKKSLQRKDLPLPPDIFNLAPLEKPKPKLQLAKVEQVKIPPKIVYEEISKESPLNREEMVVLIKASIEDAFEGYKQWASEKCKYEAQQRANRISNLEKIKLEKEKDRQLNMVRLQENAARQKSRDALLLRTKAGSNPVKK